MAGHDGLRHASADSDVTRWFIRRAVSPLPSTSNKHIKLFHCPHADGSGGVVRAFSTYVCSHFTVRTLPTKRLKIFRPKLVRLPWFSRSKVKDQGQTVEKVSEREHLYTVPYSLFRWWKRAVTGADPEGVQEVRSFPFSGVIFLCPIRIPQVAFSFLR